MCTCTSEFLIEVDGRRFSSQLAARDGPWRTLQTSSCPEMPYRIVNMPEAIFVASDQLRAISYLPDGSLPNFRFMFCLRLLQLRALVDNRPSASERRLVKYGQALTEQDMKRDALYLEEKRRKSAKKNPKSPGKKIEHDSREANKAVEAARRLEAPEKIKEMQKELNLAHIRLVNGQGVTPNPAIPLQNDEVLASLRESPLAGVRILNSTSTKLDYILNEVSSVFSSFFQFDR